MALHERVSKLEGAYEQVDKRLDDMNHAISGLRNDMNSRLNTRMQIMVGGFIAMMVAIITILLAVIGLYFAK